MSPQRVSTRAPPVESAETAVIGVDFNQATA